MTSSLKLFSLYFNSLLYKTNRFQVAVHLFSNRSQRMSKCGKNISDTLGCASCATFLFLPHFDVICNLLLNRRTATWNLFVKCNHLDKSGHLGSMFRFLCILPCKCNCMSRQCYCTQRSHHTDCDRPNIH